MAIQKSLSKCHSHLKTDFRLTRNFLKGIAGDNINLLMAACAWNMAKWMRGAILFLFALIFGLKKAPRNAKVKPSQAIKLVETGLGNFADFGHQNFLTFSGLTNYPQLLEK